MQDRASVVVQNVEMKVDRKYLPMLVRWFKSEWCQRLFAAILPQSFQVHRLKRAAYRQALYHDCPDEITELANVLLEAEPNWAGFSPLRLSEQRYGQVPKVYVECLQDCAVTPPLQRMMYAESRCDRVFTLDAGHAPVFSQPERLVAVLIESLPVFAK